MTNRYTDDEWIGIIADTQQHVTVSERPHPCPKPGSPDFARTIDHTLLKLDATSKQIDDLCAEARVAGFATVCVRHNHVAQAVKDLKSSEVRVASVIGFHQGTYDLAHKLSEISQALESGAHELDVVLNWPQLRRKQYAAVYNELSAIRTSAPHPTLLKLILETSQLRDSEIVAASVIAGYANFDYVKTSTGFLGHGAKLEHVRLMDAVCRALEKTGVGNQRMKVKASGGIRTLDDAIQMLQAGANRLGTSGGVWIVKEGKEKVDGRGSPKDGANRPGMATRLFTDY